MASNKKISKSDKGIRSGTKNKRPVLLLNSDWTVLAPISVKRSINLYSVGKVKILKTIGDRVFHPSLDIIGVPVVAQLSKWTQVPHRDVPITRKNIFLRDDFVCQYTSEKLTERSASIDHVIPKSHRNFPGNTWENLVTCSKSVNNFKSNKCPEEAGLKLKTKPTKPKWEDLLIKQKEEWKDFMDDFKNGNI